MAWTECETYILSLIRKIGSYFPFQSVIMKCFHVKSLWSCLTLCAPMDCSLLGSSLHGDSPGKNTGEGMIMK